MLPKTPFSKRPAIRRMAAAISKLTHNDSQNQNATSAQAITNLPSVTLAVPAVPAVSRTPESTARARVRNLPPPQNHLPIHKHVLDADRSLVRLLERHAIDHRLRIEHGDVGVESRFHEAAIGQIDALCRQGRHLAHRELQREQLQIA